MNSVSLDLELEAVSVKFDSLQERHDAAESHYLLVTQRWTAGCVISNDSSLAKVGFWIDDQAKAPLNKFSLLLSFNNDMAAEDCEGETLLSAQQMLASQATCSLVSAKDNRQPAAHVE